MGSLSGTLYIGMSSTLYKRVFMHKHHLLESFTAQYKVDRLLYVESFDDVHKAIAREKQLKGWRRDRKIALFARVNPHWLDLAKDWYPETKTQLEGRGASTTPEHSLRACSISAQHDNAENEVATKTFKNPSTQTKIK
jgi:putative endonuclease